MDVNMDQTENRTIAADDNSEEQQSQSEGAESNIRPPLSEIKKSWGFRRTTIARREFLEEVGELSSSPPPARKARGRRSNPTPQTSRDTHSQRASRTTKSVIDELEWSAPSSPASEDSKPASETSAGGSLDPSLWQDYGSAFHTAFSLLGGGEDLSLDMSDSRAIPDILGTSDAIEPPPPQDTDETEAADNVDSPEEMEISQPVAPDHATGGEMDDVVLISSHEEDSDDMTLIQIKEQMTAKGRQANTGARGGKGGRGKARGRGRGRGKGKGRGRGRGRGKGRGVELLSTIADHEDDEVVLISSGGQHLQEEEKINDSHSSEIERSPVHFDITLSPAQRSSSDCIIIDTDLDHVTDVTPGQYDDAPEEEEEVEEERKKDSENVREYPGVSVSGGHDSEALFCICRQKQDKRFMICCDSCQDWFHGECVGITATQGRKMVKKGQEYICPRCTTQRQLQPEAQLHPQLEPELSFPECLRPPGEEGKGNEEPQALTEAVVLVEEEKEVEEEEKGEAAHLMRPEPEPEPEPVPEPVPEADMETDSTLPLCIGPGCPKPALQDSVYCGTDCILQHAAFAMKTLSGPKVPKSKGRGRGKAATTRPTVKDQRSGRMSKRLALKAVEKEDEEEEMQADDGGDKEAASSLACDPSLSEVQTSSIPSSKFYTSSKEDSKQLEANSEAETPSKNPQEDTPMEAAPSSEPATVPAPTQSQFQEQSKDPINDGASEQKTAESVPCTPPNSTKPEPSTATQSSPASGPRHHETGALMVRKTTYVIPKKQSGPKSPSSKVPASASGQKPSSAPSLLTETRNLPVPPAPSAPSSRPSQPNNQIRQSIQRSLTSILFKRVSDCEDLEMTESDVTKLVASIEMEMFDMFRNTDSKYMNKYRTIMFNIKDPKNKGLLYHVVHSEISPFRLVRMSQKDMQAVKPYEPSPKATTEVKDAAKSASGLQKPEAVKVDLPSLNFARPIKSMEPKKSLPAPPVKARTSQPNPSRAVPDILTCMLKDTTSEHKAHLFDLKCKICTGQLIAGEEEEPAKKKPKVSETRDKYESPWRKSAGDDSPLMAPPDSPDIDSPTSSLIDPSSRLIIDIPALTIVESPASPIMDSPASPILESPASPVMDSPASPTRETPKTTLPKRAYTPVVIPAVSTVKITRRDPRTAAGRFSALSSSSSGPSNTTQTHPTPSAPFKESNSTVPSAPASLIPPKKTLPKSILMKPTSSADPRLYGTLPRTTISESPADSETAQFLAKGDIVWKGFLNMLTVAKFVTKAYLVSGPAENLKADLPDTIQIGGRIMPETVWDYVAKLKTSVTKELCVIRFHPATEEEEVAYVSLFSYFSSRRRFGVVANVSRSIKDVYLVPLGAKESIPSILHPFEGPGLEKNRPNLLLGLAIVQRVKRAGGFSQEIEEKRPKVHMSKDPMWIPKPPVLYGSDKLEIFQPYDPETPASTTPPSSPSCPGSPSGSSSSGSVTVPSLLTSITAKPPVSTSASVTASHSSTVLSDKDPSTVSSGKTPLQTILKSLFCNKKTNPIDSLGGGSTTTVSSKKVPVFSKGSRSMVDPIVQQYGQKSKVKEIEEEENDFDRPYDPEEEYEPAMGYGVLTTQSIEKNKGEEPTVSDFADDDVAYDPEDETIFADFQSDIVTKPPVSTPPLPTQTSDVPTSTPPEVPAPTSTPAQNPIPTGVTEHLPTGTVVVSAATLTEQQRMLEELNKQIEEQKRQLKEQEEALRQQREAVGMFMAHFSVADSLMSPQSKSLPLSQLPSLPSGMMQTESRPSESTNKTSNLIETVDASSVDSQAVTVEGTTTIPNFETDTNTVTEQDETQENVKESDKCSSAGEIEDSDVAYDPEDESLFDEIQEDVFRGGSHDSSLSKTGHSTSHKGSTMNSYHSRKRRLSPKRRSHRERDKHRSPLRKSQRRSPSNTHRHRERDRHRRSERERSGHRSRDHSERQGRHRRERTSSRHSREHRRSPSSQRKKDSVSPSAKQHIGHSPQVLEKPKHLSGTDPDFSDSVVGQLAESSTSSCLPLTIKKYPDTLIIKKDPDELKCNLDENQHTEQKILCNVKLEISEPSKSQVTPNYSAVDHDIKCSSSSTEADKPRQETLLHDKIENTVPLRVIDPPTRDSPESPDPEPQFMKPSSSEQSDSVEESTDPLAYNSVPVPLVKAENNCLSISGQTTLSNVLGPTPLSKDINLDWTAQNLPASRDEEMDKQIKEDSLSLNHPMIQGQVEGNSNQASCSDIQCPRLVIDPLTVCPVFEVSSPGPDVKGLVPKEPLIYIGKTDERSPGPDMRGQDTKVVSPNMWGPGQHMKPLAISCPGTNVSNPRAVMHGMETITRNVDTQQQMRGLVQGEDGPNRRGSVRDHMQSRHDDSPVIDERVPQKRDFHSHGSDADLSRAGGRCKTSLDLSVSTGAHYTVLREDGLSAAMTNETQSLQRGQGVPVRGPGPNINYESGSSNMSCIEQDSKGSREHFNQPQSYVKSEISEHGPDPRELDTMHKFRRPDVEEKRHMGSGQTMDNKGWSGTRDDTSESHAKSSSRDIGETGPNRSEADMHRRNIHGHWPEARNLQMNQENRGPMTNITNPDWRDPGTDMRGQIRQNQGPRVRDRDWNDPGSERRNEWREPDRRGSDQTRGGQLMHDERRIQPDWRGPNLETQGPDKRSAVDLNRRERGPDRNPDMEDFRYDKRGQRGSDFRRPETESRRATNDNVGPNRRSGAQEFLGIDLDSRTSSMEGPVSNRGGTNFREPLPEKRNLEMVSRRGPRHQDVWGPGNESTGQTGTSRQGPGHPDFSEPVPKRRDQIMGGPRPSRWGPGGQDFKGPEIEKGGSPVEGSITEKGVLGGPDFRGQWTGSRESGGQDFRGPRHERTGLSRERPDLVGRGTRGPDFRGPRMEKRGPPIEGTMHDPRGPGGPEFRGPGCERQECPGPERGRPVDPDFRGPGPEGREGRDPAMQGPGPERRGPGGPEFRGPGSERRECPGPERGRPGDPDFRGPGPEGREGRDPAMQGPGPERRGPGGPEFRGPGSERRECPGPERGRPGDPDFRGPGPEGREGRDPAMQGPGPDRRGPGRPDIRRPGPQRRGPPMEGPGTGQRGSGGPDLRGPGPQRRGPPMEGPGHDQRGHGGPDLGGQGPPWRGSPVEGSEHAHRGPGDPDQRGPGPHRRGPPIDGSVHDQRGPGGPDFGRPGSQRKYISIGHPGPNRGGPGDPEFRGTGPQRRGPPMEGPGPCTDFRGPGPDRGGPGDPDFRESGPRRRGPFLQDHVSEGGGPGPDFSGSEPERRGPVMHVPLPDGRGPGGPDFGRPGPERRSPAMENPLSNRRETRDPDCRGPGPEWRDPAMESMRHSTRGFGGTDFIGPGFKDFSSPVHERVPTAHSMDTRVTGMRGPQDSDFQGTVPDRRVPGGPDVREPGYEISSPSFQGPGPERRGSLMGGPGPGFIEMGPESTGPGMGCPGPHNRGQRGPQFRESVHPNVEGPGPAWKGPDFRGPRPERPGSGMEGPQDPNFRGPGIQHSGPNIEGPGQYRLGPDSPNFIGPGPARRPLDIEGTEPDRRGQHFSGGRPDRTMEGPGPHENHGQDFRGPGFHSTGQAIQGLGPHRPESGGLGFREHGERRDQDVRGPGSDWRRSGSPDLGPRGRPDFGGSENSQEGPGVEGHSNRTGQNMRSKLHSRQGPGMEWKGPGRRGQMPTQERPNMPFDEWSGPDNRGPGPTQDDPVCPGPGMGRPEKEWGEPIRGGAGPSRRDASPCFREERHLGNRGRGYNRRGPDMRVPRPDMRRGSDMGIDCVQPDFRGLNMEGPEDHRESPGLINSCPNRGFEAEGPNRRGPGDPDLIHPGPENRNLNIEGPGADGRFSDCVGRGFERQGFEHGFRRGRRGLGMRGQSFDKTDRRGPEPESSDTRHGFGRFNVKTDGPRASRAASPHFNNPHQVPRFQAPIDPHSSKYNRPFGTAQNPGSESQQNQQEAQLQRHKVALLPTPPGLIRFPNHMINKPDICSPKQRQAVHPTEKESSRSRQLSGERELVKGKKQDHDKKPDEISTPIDGDTGSKEEIKEGNEK